MYNYMKTANAGAPEDQWKFLNPADPMTAILKQMQLPPAHAMTEQEAQQQMAYQAAADHQVDQQAEATSGTFGVPDDVYAQLPLWQKIMIPLASGGGAAMGGAMGGTIGLIAGGPVGALVGGGIGAGMGYAAEKIPAAAALMNMLDALAEGVERGAGMTAQIAGSAIAPDWYGSLDEVMNDLPAAWRASHEAYQAAMVQMTGGKVAQLGQVEPNQLTQEQYGMNSLVEARRRIHAISTGQSQESLEEVYGDLEQRFGFTGMAAEMVGHMVADPLNLLGLGEAMIGEKMAKAAGKPILATAFNLSKAPLKSMETSKGIVHTLKTYGVLLRGENIDDVVKMGTLERWLTNTGVDQAGKGYWKTLDQPTKPTLAGRIPWLFQLTPSARAHEVLGLAADNLKAVLAKEQDPVKAVQYIHSLASATPSDVAQVARVAQSVEGGVFPLALRDQVKNLDEMVNNMWVVPTENRAVLTNIAGALGMEPRQLLKELADNKVSDTYVAMLKNRLQTAGTPEAAKMLEALGDMDGAALKKLAQPFIDGVHVLDAAEMNARLTLKTVEQVDGWAAKWFGVKPDPAIVRLTNTVKNAQSLVLLGVNPTYVINNAINNIVTMSFTGVLGLDSRVARDNFWKRLGVEPTRRKAGVGMAGVGEDVLQEAGREVKYQPGQAIKAAGTQEGTLTELDRFFRNKAGKFGFATRLGQIVERSNSDTAFTTASKRFWFSSHKPGVGYDYMPTTLQKMLQDIGVDPQYVYSAINRSMSRDEIEKNLFSGVARATLDRAATPEQASILREAGVYDSLAKRLQGAKDDNQVRGAFADTFREAQDAIDKKVLENLEQQSQQTYNRVIGEGFQASIEEFDNIWSGRQDFWFSHLDNMEKIYQTAAGIADPQARRAYKANAFRQSEAAWKRQWESETARLRGVVQALGGGDVERMNPQAAAVVDEMIRLQQNWDVFFQERSKFAELFNAAADGDLGSINELNRALSNALGEQRLKELLDPSQADTGSQYWAAIREAQNKAYRDHMAVELDTQTRVDDIFTGLFEKQFGDRASAEAWRSGARDVRSLMAEAQLYFRSGDASNLVATPQGQAVKSAIDKILGGKGLYKLSPEDQAKAWQQFNGQVYHQLIAMETQANQTNAVSMFHTATGQVKPQVLEGMGLQGAQKLAEAGPQAVVDWTKRMGFKHPKHAVNAINEQLGTTYKDIHEVSWDEAQRGLEAWKKKHTPGEAPQEAATAPRTAQEPPNAAEAPAEATAAVQEPVQRPVLPEEYARMSKAELQRRMVAQGYAPANFRKEWANNGREGVVQLIDKDYGRQVQEYAVRSDKNVREQRATTTAAEPAAGVGVRPEGESGAPAPEEQVNAAVSAAERATEQRTAEPAAPTPGAAAFSLTDYYDTIPEADRTTAAKMLMSYPPVERGYVGTDDAFHPRGTKYTGPLEGIENPGKVLDALEKIVAGKDPGKSKAARDAKDLIAYHTAHGFENDPGNPAALWKLGDKDAAMDAFYQRSMTEDLDWTETFGEENATAAADYYAGWMDRQIWSESPEEAEAITAYMQDADQVLVNLETGQIAEPENVKAVVAVEPAGAPRITPEQQAEADAFRAQQRVKQWYQEQTQRQANLLPESGTYGQYHREALRDDLVNVFGLSEEKADAQMVIQDALSRTWGRENGKTPSEYYSEVIAGSKKGGAGELQQVAGPERISEAAVSIDGDLYYGKSHAEAIDDAVRKGALIRRDNNVYTRQGKKFTAWDSSYFVTDAGRVLSREQVAQGGAAGAEGMYLGGAISESAIGQVLKYPERITGEVLFQQAKGATSWLDDGRAVLHALENPNFSTAHHELLHAFIRTRPEAEVKRLTEILREEGYNVTDDWHLNLNEKANVDGNEYLARAWERYAAEGVAPTPKLQAVFDKMKQWMLEVYRTISGSDIDVPISDRLREMFDGWLRDEPEPEPLPSVWDRPTKPAQANLFGDTNEDLPLMSGTAPRAQEEVFAPKEAAQQGTLIDMRPQMEGAKPGGEAPGPLMGQAAQTAGPLQTTIRTIDYAKPATDENYWGGVIASIVKDPRNITQEEWKDLNPVYDYLLKADDGGEELWQGAKTVATSRASDTGKLGDGGLGSGVTPAAKRQGAQYDRLFQTAPDPDAVKTPLGYVESKDNPPVVQAEDEAWMKQVSPALRDLESKYLSKQFDQPSGGFADQVREAVQRQMPDATPEEIDAAVGEIQRQMRGYLGGVEDKMRGEKLATTRYGESMRDFALLNYSKRTNLDTMLNMVFPYQFWFTRSMVNWALRAIDRPAMLANYARIKQWQQSTVQAPGWPQRLRGKAGIPLPFLPDWMGEGLFIDPMKQIYPFEMLSQPFEAMQSDKNLQEQKARSLLQQWASEESITPDAAQAAIEAKSGQDWEKAYAQAGLEVDQEIASPWDFMTMLSGPSLPIQWASQLARGRKDRIGQLPATRMVQNVTGALGIRGQGGILGPAGVNLEAPFRKAMGMPEIDRFYDYRVDRMLASLAAEGQVSSDDAQTAMISRQGPAFDLATQRVSLLGNIQYIGAPLSVDFFPEGEQQQRALSLKYSNAIDKWKRGDDQALTEFFDEYPEYEARLASFRDPEERLKKFMISEVWNRYHSLPDLHKKDLQKQLGPAFTEAFLNKDTRDYDAVDTQTLALWSQMMGGRTMGQQVPQASAQFSSPEATGAYQGYVDQRAAQFPDIGGAQDQLYQLPAESQDVYRQMHPELGQYDVWKENYLAENPDAIPNAIGETNSLYGLPQDVQQTVYQYRADRDNQFPGIFDTQTQYFAMQPGAQRKAFLKQHPELANYWDFKRQYAASNPKAAPYIQSEESMSKDIMGQQYDQALSQLMVQFSPELKRALAGYLYANQTLTAGATQELQQWAQQVGYQGTAQEFAGEFRR